MENSVYEGSDKKRAGILTRSLETGCILTQPIGYIESCFTAKNGTPRQPSICSLSRGCLRISKTVFNNPEHSVMDLQHFSHIWILFIFHKNGHLSCKAKVQPPRLNGAKTGVFSTRSPHRPNAIGLTLAKLEKVEGGTLYLSGIDMIQGTPVIDIKPYIAEYDSPQPVHSCGEEQQERKRQYQKCEDAISNMSGSVSSEQHQEKSQQNYITRFPSTDDTSADKHEISDSQKGILNDKNQTLTLETVAGPSVVVEGPCSSRQPKDGLNAPRQSELMCEEATSKKEIKNRLSSQSCAPNWVKDSPVPSLKVRFTPHSEMELRQFKSPRDSGGPSFRYFQSFEEAKCAISNVLSADPRSVYRRNQCLDRLFYFSLDTIHITCWFGDGFAEVLKIQPVAGQPESKN
ncbi:tRNA (adenine(37)-N6)-methyltransferase [Pseudophryne corroboree]|uniref:tRNA (adenine(37)-N6)-methyltransferase n=1 Tax=Pseudophryne corroboree TaxID=495146 RepID=UPI0030816CDF